MRLWDSRKFPRIFDVLMTPFSASHPMAFLGTIFTKAG